MSAAGPNVQLRRLMRTLEAIGDPGIAQPSENTLAALGRSGVKIPPGQSPMTPAAAVLWDPVRLNGERARTTEAAAEIAEAAVRTSNPPLDDSQRAAIASAVSRRLSVIWGPPGTGKTGTCAAMVHQLANHEARGDSDRSYNILLTGPNYKAVAELAERVMRRMSKDKGADARFFVVHREGREDEFQVPDGFAVRTTTANSKEPVFCEMIRSLTDEFVESDTTDKPNVNIVAAVVHQCPKISEQAARMDDGDPVMRPLFDFVLIDESSQADMSIAIPPLALLRDEFQLVLAGDLLQMPPVSQCDPPVGAENLVGSIQKYLVENFRVEQKTLLRNYRSAGEIVEFTKGLGYPEELEAVFPNARLSTLSDAAEFERDLKAADLALSDGWGAVLDPKKRIVAITYRDGVSGQANPFEADCVASLVYLLRKTASAKLDYHCDEGEGRPHDAETFWRIGVGVVTPHRAQRAAIVRSLRRTFPDDEGEWIEGAVDTVERFQGGERHTIIVSFGVGDPDLIAGEEKFLMQLERTNVAISRAMAKCIVLLSEEVARHVPADRNAIMTAYALKGVVDEWCKDREEAIVLSRTHGRRRITIRSRPAPPLIPYRDWLLKKLESFEIVVVPRSGIKSDLAGAYAHWKKDQNVKCWAQPPIRTWQEHIRHVWGMSSHDIGGQRLLSPIEFRYHWMDAGIWAFDPKNLSDNGANPDPYWRTRYVSDICDDAVSTWKFVNTCDIDLEDQKKDDTLKGRFCAWVDKYRSTAKSNGWISDAELARALHKKFSQEPRNSDPLLPRYERRTLFITLPGEEDDRIEYIKEATRQNVENECIELTCDSSNNGGANYETRFVKFDTSNEEIEAAAAWALRQLESNAANDSVPTSPRHEFADSIRIGIVIPNTGLNTLAVERQFLATFCPDGYRAWETPRFRIAGAKSLLNTYACQQVLSYVRTRYASEIDYIKARDFLRSGRHSGLIPSDALKDLEEKMSNDDRMRSSFEAPPSWGENTESHTLAKWLAEFRELINGSLDTSRSNLQSEFGDPLYTSIAEHLYAGRRPSLDDLIYAAREALRPSAGSDTGETECADARERRRRVRLLLEILTRIRESGAGAQGDSTPQSRDEKLLSRLEQLIESIDEEMTVCRLIEVVENFRQIVHRAEGRMKFGQAYAILRSACRGEMLSGDPEPCPVEILSLEQAVGRHFTSLWVMGMRDSEWPPPVRPNPLLDMELSKTNKSAAKLFDHGNCYQRALDDLLLTTAYCSNRDAIVVSYAERDSSTDRLFMGSRGLGALRTGRKHAGFSGTQHESLMWTDSSCFRRYEFLGGYAFHPVYSGVDEQRRDWFESFPEKYHDNVPLLDAEDTSSESSRGRIDEAPTRQFECPFRAFAIHRLSVEQRQGRSGSEGFKAAAKRKRIRELREKVQKPRGTAGVEDEWLRSLVPMDQEDPDLGICSLDLPTEKNGSTRKYIVDCSIGFHGDFETEHLQPPDVKAKWPQISLIEYLSFEDLLRREKYYPLRILQYAVDHCAGDEYVGYIVGKKNTGKLEVVKHFKEPLRKLLGLPDLIEKQRKAFKDGQMKPDPITGRRGRKPPVCEACHLGAACRYHFVGDPYRPRTSDEK